MAGRQIVETPRGPVVIHVAPETVRFRVGGPPYRRGMADVDFAAACRELRGEAPSGGPYVFWGIDWASEAL